MRLIGSFNTEKEAYAFYSFLLKAGIQNIYEPYSEATSKEKRYRVWVYDEEDLPQALEWQEEFTNHPEDPKFQLPQGPVGVVPPTPEYSQISEEEEQKWDSMPKGRLKNSRFSYVLTYLIIVLCGFLFFWNDVEESRILEEKGQLALEISMTPLEKTLLFDLPATYAILDQVVAQFPLKNYKKLSELPTEAQGLIHQAEVAPRWVGIYSFLISIKNQGWEKASQIPLFEKIRQGQVWRLFTPCMMHRDFLHILFNMIWAWLLLKQIEFRLKRWKICVLILLIGVVSNCAQYLISGPNFIGFSGVVVGLAGFIWVRQRRAPWEGYPLQKSTFLFLLFFVLSMFALEVVTFGLQLFSVIQIAPVIANTAHIVGGLCGMYLGRLSFFSRSFS